VNLRPLGDRVLIKPEIPADTTESGLVLMEHRKPEQTGTVVAVGPCAHPRKAEAEELAAWLEVLDADGYIYENEDWVASSAALVRALVSREPLVSVGDYVVFSWTAGQEIWVEDGEERLLLMRESDILCVVEGLPA
jgi:co-chaperonin GroES (HSP10)